MEEENILDELSFQLASKNLRIEIHKKLEDGSDEMIWRYGWNSKETPDRNKNFCGIHTNPNYFTNEELELIKRIIAIL